MRSTNSMGIAPTQGGFAEYTKARACDLIPISEAWSFAEWAAIPLTYVTSWNMLHHRARLKASVIHERLVADHYEP